MKLSIGFLTGYVGLMVAYLRPDFAVIPFLIESALACYAATTVVICLAMGDI